MITAGPFYATGVTGGRRYDFNMTDHLLTQPQPDAAVLQQIVDAIEQTIGYALPLPTPTRGYYTGPNWWLRTFTPRRVPELWLRVIDPVANLTPVVDQLYGLVDPAHIFSTNGVLNQVFLSFDAMKDAPYNIIINHFGPFGEEHTRQLKEEAQKVYLASHLVTPSGVTDRDEIARALAAADLGNATPLVFAALTKSAHVSEV